MGELGKQLQKRLRQLDENVAQAYALEGQAAAVKEAPGPEKSPYATGRTRESITTSAGQPNIYNPPESSTYVVPGPDRARQGISGRRPLSSTFLQEGTTYRQYVEPLYGNMEAGNTAGLAAVRKASHGARN